MPSISRRQLIGGALGGAALTAAASPARAEGGRRIAIIGSGYGGAVAAHRLADAGHSADLIEMGMDWRTADPVNGKVFTSMTSPSARSMWFQDHVELPFSSILGIPTSLPTRAWCRRPRGRALRAHEGLRRPRARGRLARQRRHGRDSSPLVLRAGAA